MKSKSINPVILAFTIPLYYLGCSMGSTEDFKVRVDRFADIEILRYQVPEFEKLSLRQKKFVYYLSEAALSGRDILYDQNYKHNLTIRQTIHSIVEGYKGDKNTRSWKQFMVYAKRIWFSNGIHHHYSTLKIIPEFNKSYLAELINNTNGKFPLINGGSTDEFIEWLTPILFDPEIDGKRINLDPDVDIISTSANNYYDGVSQDEVDMFYSNMKDPNDSTPIWYGLNSRLTKKDGKIVEKVWKSGGLYGNAIDQIIMWLEKAKEVAENDSQTKELEILIDYYRTGDLRTWDKYNMAWVKNTEIDIDYINGFIEVYGDPKGIKASYESVVEINDFEATARMKTLSDNGLSLIHI